MLAIFIFSRPLIGRTEIPKERIIEHISYYAGGAITSLDWLLSNQKVFDENRKNCFIKFWKFFHLPKPSNEKIFDTRGFFSVNSYILGNVYTPIYRYWHDYGLFGVIIIFSFISIFINYIYYYLKYTNNIGIIFFIYLYYCVPVLFLVTFDDILLNNYMFSAYTIEFLFYNVLVFKVLKIRIKPIFGEIKKYVKNIYCNDNI